MIYPAVTPAIRSAFEGGYGLSLLAQSMGIVRKYGGALYNPSNMASLFQDSAGTIPVTAAGQPVGLMLDVSGNGNHAAQSTTTARPTYQIVDGYPCIVGDGVDDFFSINPAFINGKSEVTVMAAIRKISDTARQGIFRAAQNVPADAEFRLDAPQIVNQQHVCFRSGSPATFQAQASLAPTPAKAVLAGIGRITPPLVELRVNGVIAQSLTANQGSAAYNASSVWVFKEDPNNNYSSAAIFALSVTPTILAEAKLTILTRFAASRSGVTLA